MVNAAQNRPETFLENTVFYLSLLLLVAVFGAFFYVRYSITQSTAELGRITVQLEQTKTEEHKLLEARIAAARRKMSDFSQVLASRKSAVNFFNKFEGMVSENVYYSKLNLDMDKMAVLLNGHGSTFQDLGRQIIKFGAAVDGLSDSNLGKVAINNETGSIDFDANIVLKPGMVVSKQSGAVEPPILQTY